MIIFLYYLNSIYFDELFSRVLEIGKRVCEDESKKLGEGKQAIKEIEKKKEEVGESKKIIELREPKQIIQDMCEYTKEKIS